MLPAFDYRNMDYLYSPPPFPLSAVKCIQDWCFSRFSTFKTPFLIIHANVSTVFSNFSFAQSVWGIKEITLRSKFCQHLREKLHVFSFPKNVTSPSIHRKHEHGKIWILKLSVSRWVRTGVGTQKIQNGGIVRRRLIYGADPSSESPRTAYKTNNTPTKMAEFQFPFDPLKLPQFGDTYRLPIAKKNPATSITSTVKGDIRAQSHYYSTLRRYCQARNDITGSRQLGINMQD